MVFEDREKRAEEPREAPSAAPESAIDEVNASRTDLVKEQRQYDSYVRSGGRTGITDEFGKLELTGVERRDGDGKAEPGREGSGKPGGDGEGERGESGGERGGERGREAGTEGGGERGESSGERDGERGREAGTEGDGERGERAGERPAEGDGRFAAHPNFRGEVIRLDVEPSIHEFRRGERLRDIAREHLGPDASQEDVRRHVREIERLNHLRRGEPIRDGRTLRLPGHTASGGFVVTEDDPERGTVTRTTWADGVERVVWPAPGQGGDAGTGEQAGEERQRTAGFVRRPTEDGGYSEHRWGPRPEDNFDFTRTADGRFQIEGADAQAGDSRIGRAQWDNPEAVREFSQAAAGLDRRIQDMEDRALRQPGEHDAELRRFEHMREQMQEFDRRAQRDGVSPEEVARTYREVQRLMESDATEPTDAAQRLALADQILEHAAHPETIDQGQHNTCNVASIETRMYSRNPSAAAHLVTEVATTGRFTERGPDGTEITIDPASIRPDGEASGRTPDGRDTYDTRDGDRDYASQIFQVTAVNIHHAHHDMVWTHPDGREEILARAGEVEYRQRTPGAPHDTGERLIRRATGEEITEPPPHESRQIREPFLRASDLPDISERITGQPERQAVLTNERDDLPNTTHFDSQWALEREVARLQSEGQLPAVLRVHTGNEPFFSDSRGGAVGGSGGWHDITITGYDRDTHRISIDNQWGSEHDRSGDRAMTAHDLYLATLRPGSPEILRELRAREAETHGFDDRMALLRQERMADPPLARGELNRRMAEALNDSYREHPDTMAPPPVLGTIIDPVQDQREVRFLQDVLALPERDRRDVIGQLDPTLQRRMEQAAQRYDRTTARAARGGERDGDAGPAGRGPDVGESGERESGEDQRGDSESGDGRRGDSRPDTGEGQVTLLSNPRLPEDLVVQPATRAVESGDTLPDLARTQLGPDATQEELDRYVRHIERANHLPQGATLEGLEMLELQLPGVTDDGGYVTIDRDQTVRTLWQNGTERVQHPDGRGHVHRLSENGAYMERHWGPRYEDNYRLTRTSEGRYLIAREEGEEPVDRTDANDARVNRARWDEPAETMDVRRQHRELVGSVERATDAGLMTDEQNRELLQDVQEFQDRAREQGLPPEEVEQTLYQVHRLLDQPDERRVLLARQIMEHAADPSTVEQGYHNTCGTASLEAVTYTRQPSTAAQMVADVALQGHYTTRDGSRIEVTPDMMAPVEERNYQQGGNTRSLASEIFQVTAVNVYHQRHGDYRYIQRQPDTGHNPPDTGELLIDTRTGEKVREQVIGPNGQVESVIRRPNLSDDQIMEVSQQILGPQDAPPMLNSAERQSELGSGYQMPESIESPTDLRHTLTEMRRDGRLPATMIVHSGNEPFWSDSGAGAAGGSGGWHVVTITDYDERTGMVSVDNQWGEGNDHQGDRAISADDLFRASMRPDSPRVIRSLEQEAQQEGAEGESAGIDLLRHRQLVQPPLSDQQHDQTLSDLLQRTQGRWAREDGEHEPDAQQQQERAQLLQQYTQALSRVPEDRRDAILDGLDPSMSQRFAWRAPVVPAVAKKRSGAEGGADSAQQEEPGADGQPSSTTGSAAPAGAGTHSGSDSQPGSDTRSGATTAAVLEPDLGYVAQGRRGGAGGGHREEAAVAEAPEPAGERGSRPAEAGETRAPDGDASEAGESGEGTARERRGESGAETSYAAFHGADIRRDVQPATHTYHDGEDFQDIARSHLGEGATQAEIEAHAQEIMDVNSPPWIEGDVMTLPGHTADGGYVAAGQNGNRQTSWQDGVVRVENADGTGWVRRPTADGGITEHHWGPRQGDNFDLERISDGRYRITDAGGEMHEVENPGSDVRVQRAHLEEVLDSRYGGPNERTARIRDDMREFERRAREQRPPLSDEEIACTYAEVSRIAEHEGDEPLGQPERLNIAEQVVHQAAYPDSIDQGQHETCGAAATEVRMYTRNPADAARLVADVSTGGEFETRSEPHRTIVVNPENIRPRDEERGESSRSDARTHASQVFQSAFITTVMENRSDHEVDPPYRVSYELRDPSPPDPANGIPPDDSGERVIIDTGGERTETPFDGLFADELQRAEEDITGRTDRPHVLINEAEAIPTGAAGFSSERELRSRLQEAHDRNEMPVVMWVDSANEPFRSDSGGGWAGGSGGGHFVTITDFDPETGQVTVDNQWGDEHDHDVQMRDGQEVDRRMSVHELYRASIPERELLRRDVEWDREHGTVDGCKELQALLIDRQSGDVSQQEFDEGLARTMRANRQRWQSSGETYPGERQRTEDRYRQFLAAIRRSDAARAEAIEQAVEAQAE